MKTITLTEFNQNPSRAVRLAETDEVIVMRRGVPAYRLERVRAEPTDPVDALVQLGLLTPARRKSRSRARPLPVASTTTTTDLGALLDADRGRLDA